MHQLFPTTATAAATTAMWLLLTAVCGVCCDACCCCCSHVTVIDCFMRCVVWCLLLLLLQLQPCDCYWLLYAVCSVMLVAAAAATAAMWLLLTAVCCVRCDAWCNCSHVTVIDCCMRCAVWCLLLLYRPSFEELDQQLSHMMTVKWTLTDHLTTAVKWLVAFIYWQTTIMKSCSYVDVVVVAGASLVAILLIWL